MLGVTIQTVSIYYQQGLSAAKTTVPVTYVPDTNAGAGSSKLGFLAVSFPFVQYSLRAVCIHQNGWGIQKYRVYA